MSAILKILAAIATALETAVRVLRRRRQEKHEEEVRHAQDNPADWFDEHFNDLDRVHDLPDDAEQTGEADATKPDEDK